MRKCVIIVAGGSGSRFGSAVPKQFLDLAGKPVLMHTIDAFASALEGAEHEIVLVLPAAQMDYWRSLCAECEFETEHTLVSGGSSRFESVKNGLWSLGELKDGDVVAVHDGVRPLVTKKIIVDTFAIAAREGSAIPVVNVVDSMRHVDASGESVAVDRSSLKAVQTPQAFDACKLKAAYNVPFDEKFTDDASVFERAGHKVTLCEGDARNLKITHKLDLLIAEKILENA